MKPTVIVCKDSTSASREVADRMTNALIENPRTVLGLATGGTPIETYRFLVDDYRAKKVDFSKGTSFNLDEYIGLSGDHPQSFRHFMREYLFDRVNFRAEKTFVPSGLAESPEQHAIEYEKLIADAGGIDLQLLGIGHNAHIAFNEPGSSKDSRTRVVRLTSSTIEKNSRFFDRIEDVPRAAITMGIGTILEAKQIILLAMGADKAEAVRRSIEETPCDEVPASWLQLHSGVIFVLDEAAANRLGSH